MVSNGRALFVEGRKGKLSLPGGAKLSGEAPQCTAERETWEEAGISVRAQNRLYTFENGFQVFDCDLLPDQSIRSIKGTEGSWGLEIVRVHWLALSELDEFVWRFPDQLDVYKNLLIQRNK